MKVNRIKGLDSLRFFAFLWVYLGHATSFWKTGYLGIYLFFVLSSFLLTYLSLVEIKDSGNFSAANFFFRRSLKLYPLYFLVLSCTFLFAPVVEKLLDESISLPQQKAMYFFFVSNLDFTDHIYALKFLWTISVEEQFYMIFILLSPLFKTKFHLPVLILLGLYFLGYEAYKVFGFKSYTFTTTYFSCFAVGMVLAKLYFENKVPSILALIILTVTFCILSMILNQTTFKINYAEIPISLCIGALMLLLVRVCESYPYAAKYLKFTDYLGKYTYGLYVYSGFVLTFANIFFKSLGTFNKFICQSLILFVIAWISYHFFEIHFIYLKRKISIVKQPPA